MTLRHPDRRYRPGGRLHRRLHRYHRRDCSSTRASQFGVFGVVVYPHTWMVLVTLARRRAAGRRHQRLHHHPLQRGALHRHARHAPRGARPGGAHQRAARRSPTAHRQRDAGQHRASGSWARGGRIFGIVPTGPSSSWSSSRSWPAFVTTRTPFGRGSTRRAATSAPRSSRACASERTKMIVYMISAFCAATVGTHHQPPQLAGRAPQPRASTSSSTPSPPSSSAARRSPAGAGDHAARSSAPSSSASSTTACPAGHLDFWQITITGAVIVLADRARPSSSSVPSAPRTRRSPQPGLPDRHGLRRLRRPPPAYIRQACSPNGGHQARKRSALSSR